MPDPIKWGILSTGKIAHKFAAAALESRTAELYAVASRSQETADAFADDYKIPKRYAGYDALIADPEVDAVYIAPPHPFHAEWALRCAATGKHMLCEKPLTMNHPEAMAVIEATRQNDVFLLEAFAYRHTPQTARLVELIRDGAIGELRVIESAFSFNALGNPLPRHIEPELGGGGIMDVGCYPVSMCRLLAGAALGRSFANPLEVQGFAHLGDTAVDEYAVGNLRFENDILGQISSGVGVARDNTLRIFGSEGSIVVDSPWWSQGGIRLTRKGKEPELIEVEQKFSLYVYEIDALAEHLKARQAPGMTWDDTLGNMDTLDRWRAAVGLTYPCEQPDARVWPIQRPALEQKASTNMTYGRVQGLDKDISQLVMGTVYGPSHAHFAVMFDDYFERGGNTFDSSDIYGRGRAESLLGQWVKNRGVRDDIVILDKSGHTPFCWPEILRTSIPESLERLQTDYIDIFMLHRDNLEVPVGEFIDVLNQHIQAGRIRVLGVSNWTRERIDEANAYAESKGLQGFVAVSNNFSLARMVNPVWPGCLASSEPDYKAWHIEKQMPLFPWSSQAAGFFTDRSAPDKKIDSLLVHGWYSDDNFERKRRATQLAEEKGVLPINIALAYVLAQPFPVFALAGPRTLEEIRTTLPAFDLDLTPDELSWLNLEKD